MQYDTCVPCCPICLDDINEFLFVTICGHSFHSNCFYDYMVHSSVDNIMCPICRRFLCYKLDDNSVSWVDGVIESAGPLNVSWCFLFSVSLFSFTSFFLLLFVGVADFSANNSSYYELH